MIEQLSLEYVTAARIKGAPSGGGVAPRFSNIMVPLITVHRLELCFAPRRGGVTETVFAWPGLGLYITRSLFSADMSAVLGGTLMVGGRFHWRQPVL